MSKLSGMQMELLNGNKLYETESVLPFDLEKVKYFQNRP